VLAIWESKPNKALTMEMLIIALKLLFKKAVLETAMVKVNKILP
jgi:hypothetical protein